MDGEKNDDPYQLRKCRTFSNSAAVLKPKPRYLKPFDHNDKSPVYLMQIPVERIEDNDSKVFLFFSFSFPYLGKR